MKSLLEFCEMIKLEHSLFALPFALSGMLLARHALPQASIIFWIIVAMVSARTVAMGLNRVIDAAIDAKNPRTMNRAIPRGAISKKRAITYICISLVIYFFATYMMNDLTFMLSPIPVAIFLLYSYTKRFTNMCHMVLGLALGLAPVGAWVAVTGELSFVPFILCFAVMSWVAGFDILYALQDLDFDKKSGLYSIPVLLGVHGALIVARLLHLAAFILFAALSFYANLGCIYAVGVLITGALMVYEHFLVSKYGLSKLNTAFFGMNAYISIAIFIFTAVDIMVFG